jgi:glucosamine-6-phosphate deaminase
MLVIRCKNYDECSKAASDIFKNALKENPNMILGLATGSSPIGIYQNLIKDYENGEISFKNVRTYNLDEYVGITREHPQSYYYFMNDNLFNHVDINKENVHVPFAYEGRYEESCKAYTEELKKVSVDIQLLGIGANGHIGFNEPGTPFDQETFVVTLAEKTRQDNKRFFNSIDEVPTHAMTMGIANIMNAKSILMLISGAGKADTVVNLLKGEITPDFPASILHKHPNVTVIIDEAAYAKMNQ